MRAGNRDARAFAHEAIAAERQGWDIVMWAWGLFEKALDAIASV
jgi:hypothetical protein